MLVVGDIVKSLDLRVVAGENQLGRGVTGGYVGDLLSCVMSKATLGNVWVTVQGHPNVVAVATLVGISGIIITEAARIEPATLDKAEQEGIPVLVSRRPSFDVVAHLVALGVKGSGC